MNEQDRKLMMQIAGEVDTLKAWRIEHEKAHPTLKEPAVVPTPDGEPQVLIATGFREGFEAQGTARTQEIHARIRGMLKVICRAEQIDTLQINFTDK